MTYKFNNEKLVLMVQLCFKYFQFTCEQNIKKLLHLESTPEMKVNPTLGKWWGELFLLVIHLNLS